MRSPVTTSSKVSIPDVSFIDFKYRWLLFYFLAASIAVGMFILSCRWNSRVGMMAKMNRQVNVMRLLRD